MEIGTGCKVFFFERDTLEIEFWNRERPVGMNGREEVQGEVELWEMPWQIYICR